MISVYPIDNILPQIKEAVMKQPAVVLHAPPGAGKTTRVPLALLDVLPEGRIVMLEPRRIAAVSAARWMARSLQEQAGDTVGYTIRFDSKVSPKTRVEVVTEGILTRRIQSDPGLEGVSLVIFDEFHERSIHADLALALCLDVRKALRPDLKILVMSATLDYGPIASLLGSAPVITSTGKAFPVQERYTGGGAADFVSSRVVSAIRAALPETHGDILAFLPGAGEIRACARELQESLNLEEERLSLHPLYGDLPFEEQERAIVPARDRRKIVLATNIAETSLTIEGVHVVIDSGLTRRLRYDPSTGMNRLVTLGISRASAEQRRGRAGRLGPGVCYRLYTEQELKGMSPFTPPEILESDLAPLALELVAWGVKDHAALAWLDPPPVASWDSGMRLLRELGAIDDSGSITSLGRDMAQLPLHPRLAKLMVRARELGCLRLGAELAAILSEREMIRKRPEGRSVREPDMSGRLELLRKWQRNKNADVDVDAAACRTIDRSARQLLGLMRDDRRGNADAVDQERVSRLLLAAYPDRVCKQREEGSGSFVLSQGRALRLSPDSHLLNNRYLIALRVDAGEKAEGVIHVAAPVELEVVRSECGRNIETVRRVEWEHREGRIVSAIEERLGALTLSKKAFTAAVQEVIPVLCATIRTTPDLLSFDIAVKQLQARVALLARGFPEESWPDLSDQALLSNPEEWLAPWLDGIRTARGLRDLDILPVLKAKLSREQQRHLEVRTPLHITVPSGSSVKIDYTSGDQPVLAVKLQEMFGLADTPVVAGGRVKLVLHLLSPARRPVQITQDLKGFWNTGYPLVKKDLKGRYPKHPWPDDPWNAKPTRKTKPRGQ